MNSSSDTPDGRKREEQLHGDDPHPGPLPKGEGAIAPRSLCLWPAVVTLLLCATVLLAVWNWPEVQGDYRTIITAVTLLGTFAALLYWVFRLAGFSADVRWMVAGGVFVLVAAAIGSFRLEGYSGDLVPQLAFRWTPRVVKVRVEGGAADLAARPTIDFPQFQGPRRTGEVFGVRLNLDWQAHPPKELWRRPIGYGFGGIAVVGTSAITQQQEGEHELVVCYELWTGAVLWKHADRARYAPAEGRSFGGIGPRATPTVRDGMVYSMGATGIVNCLDGRDGSVVWSRNVIEETGGEIVHWGSSCSPLLVDDLVVVSAGQPRADGADGDTRHHTLVALDRTSGEIRWRAGDDAAGYSSPALATLDGVPQILSVNAHSVTAHDPADGRVLWQRPWPEERSEMPNVSQPVPLPGDRVFVSKGYSQGAVLWHVARAGDDWSVTEPWRNRRLMKTKFTNVVVRERFMYGLSETIMECIDWETGQRQWQHRGGFGHGQILLAGDVILILTENGEVVLIEANPTAYVEVARFQPLSGRTWNPPALAGKYLVVRNDREIACYELAVKSE